MGADLIGVGWTARKGLADPLEPAEALELIFRHRREILDDPTTAEFFYYDEIADGEILKRIAQGLEDIRTGGDGRLSTSYAIAGTEFIFYYTGGTSWGDSPVDNMDEMSAAIYFCERIPEIGDRIGVLGSGILPFGRPTN